MPKSLSWHLECPNCGFEYQIYFDFDEPEENKKEFQTCPCGSKMKVVYERVFDDA